MKIWNSISACLFCILVPTIGWSDQAREDAIVVRAVERMQGFDYTRHPKVVAAIGRHIDRCQGTPEYIQLIKRFRPQGIEVKLQRVVLADDNSAAVEAIQLWCELPGGPQLVRKLLQGNDEAVAVRCAEVLGLLGNGRSHKILSDMASNPELLYGMRRAAVAGLARNQGGQKALLSLATSKKLAGDTRLIAGALLARSGDAGIRSAAAASLPQPKQKDQKPLPPLDRLAQMKGDVENGSKLFQTTATCAKCHKVGQSGKEVGPNLSEIGSKLSREAMFTSILDPSAGISHNYENYLVLTDEGQTITGLKVSETEDQIVIRTAEAIDRKISKDEIENIKKSDKSIMPENLHHLVDQQGLIDVVEYMLTLKKKQ